MIKNHCLQILSVGKGEMESENEDPETGNVRKPFENTMEMEDPKVKPKVESQMKIQEQTKYEETFENTMEMEDPQAEPKVESKNEDPEIDKM